MKKFILKSLLLITAIMIALMAIDKLLPFYWGNRMLLSKMEVLNKQKDVNTLFIGGSTVFRQIDPLIFDSEVNDKSIKSFNLGTDGCYPTQCYYITEKILNNNDFKIKNIFISLNAFDPIPKGRYKTTRIKFYSTFKVLTQRLKYVLQNQKITKREQHTYIKKYFNTFFEAFLKIGMRRDIIQYLLGHSSFGSNYFGTRQNGYVALSGEHTNNSKTISNIENATKKIGQKWSQVRANNLVNDYNKAHLSIIKKLISDSEKIGCKLIFILPPQQFVMERIQDIYGLYDKIPDTNKVDVNDPSKFPLLYELSHKWDAAHLNDKGAKYYSKALVSQYNNKI